MFHMYIGIRKVWLFCKYIHSKFQVNISTFATASRTVHGEHICVPAIQNSILLVICMPKKLVAADYVTVILLFLCN